MANVFQGGGGTMPIPAEHDTISGYGGAANPIPAEHGSQGGYTGTLPTIQVGQSYTPDYAALLAADPGYIQAQAAYKQLQATSAAQRSAALRSLAVRYGFLPSGFKDQYGDLNSDIVSQAQSNQNSELARLGRSYDQGVQQLKSNLAARGMLQSGDLGYGLNQADIAKGEQEYDLGNQFQDQANQVVNDYINALSGGQTNLTNAILGAEQNVIQNPANMPVVPQQATFLPDSIATYGVPVYETADGSRYRQDGTPFSF